MNNELKKDLVVSTSGGKSSMFMADFLIKNYSDEYNFYFVFANTGREHEGTLDFLEKSDKHFNLNLIWLEAIIDPKLGIGPKHKQVNFKTANRDGKVFENFIAKEGIPNTSRQHCTDRLKTQVIRSWMREKGILKNAKTAIGYRFDEQSRADPNKATVKRYNLVYPICNWGHFDKQDVDSFWEYMPFTLDIPPHYGNCLTCFKKSDPKLYRNYHEHPEWFDWNIEMDKKYGKVKAGDNNRHVFFRKQRDTEMLIRSAKMFDHKTLIHMTKTIEDHNDGCSSSCDPFSQIDMFDDLED